MLNTLFRHYKPVKAKAFQPAQLCDISISHDSWA